MVQKKLRNYWEKELKAALVALFEIVYRCLPGRIYENHEKAKSKYSPGCDLINY